MKTLTITDARKNLGKWLQAAARGEDIGIISGADVIALRKVGVQSTDYAWREYGVTPEQVSRYERSAIAEHGRLKKAGKLEYLTQDALRAKREKTARH
jgi:antitoxin (DNA-binding transcriptional repressor) of toxin-antitoxin stability system